jgi:membrane protein implicated in regulation of membrane protease activity
MYWIYGVCAAIGGTVLVCQFAMTLLGLGDGDMDMADDLPDDIPDDLPDDAGGRGGHGTDWLFGVLSFRTIVAAMAFFGLAGLACLSAQMSELRTIVIASLAGVAAMYFMHWTMQMMLRLRAEGTVRIERTVGMTGTVYLRIPGSRQGAGKVVVQLQDRTMEYLAITPEADLPTGAKVVVTGIVGSDTLEVAPAAEPA